MVDIDRSSSSAAHPSGDIHGEPRQTQVTIVSHTHWDRAWYVTYQEFRARLVRLVDRLLHVLKANPNFRVFMLDGQMAVLEDYLEVRPQRQSELESYCKSGRLKVGPWYVLADEFLVSPEALIRNMQLGHRMGLVYGGVSKIGYVPDGFGHIAQLPQILRGFGIDNAFFWRGLGTEGERLGTEFNWKSPDGSTVLAVWMPYGYHNISNLGYPIHWGDTSQMEFDTSLALKQIENAIQVLLSKSNTHALLLMNGIDHEEAEPRLPELIAQAADLLPGYSFIQGGLMDHLDHIRASGQVLPEFCGEFRWGKYSEILQGVYAARIHLKQINQRIETLLERYAEPLSALAQWSGAEIPEGTQDLVQTSWRWLLKNHPHDDIYGSGIDAVHDEMLYRFNQAEQIARVIVRDNLRQLARQVDFSRQPGMPVFVFNPLGWERQEIVTGEIDFDFDDPSVDNFVMLDHEGHILPIQVLQIEEAFWMETLKANRKRRVRLAFPAWVPACGYTSFYIQPAPEEALPKLLPQERIKENNTISESNVMSEFWNIYQNGAENQFLSFSISTDGGVTIHDKASGITYAGLAQFEDVEDAGDEYSYCPFPDSQPLTTRGQPVQVRLISTGPNLVTFEINRQFEVPASLSADRKTRSADQVRLPIISQITLYRSQPGLFIETRVENLARDHKLSVVFPTGMTPDVVHVDQPFLVLPRPVDLPESSGWVEDPTPSMHQRAFTDISQDGRGLAILNRGLPAVEITRGQEGVQMAITLLRCVGWLSRDDLWNRRVPAGPLVPTPGAQCLGRYNFEYAIYPHLGDWRSVYPAAYNYIAPISTTRADTHEGLELSEMNITRDNPARVKPIPWPRSGPLPDAMSFITIDRPELVLSSLHLGKTGDNLIVRFFNIESSPVSAYLTCSRPLGHAWLVNLNEERQGALSLQGEHSLVLTAGGNQVITLELEHLSV